MNLEITLKTLRSPCCHAPLSKRDAELVCGTCEQTYPIEDEIPVLLLPETRTAAQETGS